MAPNKTSVFILKGNKVQLAFKGTSEKAVWKTLNKKASAVSSKGALYGNGDVQRIYGRKEGCGESPGSRRGKTPQPGKSEQCVWKKGLRADHLQQLLGVG